MLSWQSFVQVLPSNAHWSHLCHLCHLFKGRGRSCWALAPICILVGGVWCLLAVIRFVLQYLFDFTCVGYSWGLTFSDIWKLQIKIKIYFLLTQKDVNTFEIAIEIVNTDILGWGFAPSCVKMTKVVKSVVRVQLLVNQVSIFTCPLDRSGGWYWGKSSCSK